MSLIRISLLFGAVGASPIRLAPLNINRSNVVTVGFDHSADFAHQLHIAFSSMVSGACIFSGQPFHCAVSFFDDEAIVPKTPWTHVPNCDGCLPGFTLPFDHCKHKPDVVDVGSLVDYPRRHCGQNPITRHECFDAVENLKASRVFAFRGSHDEVYPHGAVENTVALLAQMISEPAVTMKLVTDEPFAHVLPLASTHYFNTSTPAGYDGPGECLRHVFNAPLTPGSAKASGWAAFDQTEFVDDGVGFQDQGWVYVPEACKAKPCNLVVRPDKCAPPTAFCS